MQPFQILVRFFLVGLVFPPAGHAFAADTSTIHFRCDEVGTTVRADLRLSGVWASSRTLGALAHPQPMPNVGSWQFDGRTAIAYAIPGTTPGFAENFTWEGFFLSPASNTYLAETGIADRLMTQFAFDQGTWTRLAIGLVADRAGSPRLCVELEGFEGRTFGQGNHRVPPDRWHHFALVHEGTAAAARIRWYLDYQLTGELFLGGQANQNTLRPPGAAPCTIGARLKQNSQVNRGFEGWIDEIRLVPKPLRVDQFLRCVGPPLEAMIEADTNENVPLAGSERATLWQNRHRWAREQAARWARTNIAPSSIDAFFPRTTQPTDDASFLRRLSLTVRGRIPTLDEVTALLNDNRLDRRTRAVDRILASPEWADGWVGYWQDVLAENPSVVFPTLNNSGAFRQWIYESFRDNKPFDRFATELILMTPADDEASGDSGPAGFALATGNDVPMAMRSHVAMKAFAAVDLKCARCHDSPVSEFQQADLFLLAAYLNGGPLTVPASSVAAAGKTKEAGAITTTLAAGQVLEPTGLTSTWLPEPETASSLQPIQTGSRAELAALITSPRNRRFSDVIVNRVWKRYFGRGLVEPVDQWPEGQTTGNPTPDREATEGQATGGQATGGQATGGQATGNQTTGNHRIDDRTADGHASLDPLGALRPAARASLLHLLSTEFVASGYDLKYLGRRILVSDIWQARRFHRERMSAEQLVDSLFVAAGKTFQAETLGVHATDAGAVQLPRPERAWQFAALPNERDRPALGMPVNQTIVDVMATYGWTGNRQQPRSEREQTISAHQPLMLFNGLMSQRITRLSDQSAITELCLQDIPLETMIDRLFLTVLGRHPDDDERQTFVAYLNPTFDRRATGRPRKRFEPLSTFQPDWRKHLEAEQTRLMFDARQRVARGERPTERLTTDFRERVEDILWALINSPEFIVIP